MAKKNFVTKQLLLVFGFFFLQWPSVSVLESVNTVLSTTLFCLFTAMNCAVQVYLLLPCQRPIVLHNKHQRRQKHVWCCLERAEMLFTWFHRPERVLTYFTVIWETVACFSGIWFTVNLLYGKDEVLAMLSRWRMKVQWKDNIWKQLWRVWFASRFQKTHYTTK